MQKAWLLCGVVVAVIAACKHAEPVDVQRNMLLHGMRNPAQTQAPDYYESLTDKIPSGKYLTFKKLLEHVKNGKIADTLQSLKEDYKDYLKYYTLVYESGSAQKASFENPRAIVFGPDAKFIFTFNGHASQVGGNTIETMTFNNKTKEFELREILFKNERPGRKTSRRSV
jgi:hypothetical protein